LESRFFRRIIETARKREHFYTRRCFVLKMARYVCKESCKGSVSEEEFNAGKKTCAAEGCDNFGKPLVSEVAPEQPAQEKQ